MNGSPAATLDVHVADAGSAWYPDEPAAFAPFEGRANAEAEDHRAARGRYFSTSRQRHAIVR